LTVRNCKVKGSHSLEAFSGLSNYMEGDCHVLSHSAKEFLSN
jgi:hypothetical protein